MKSWRFMARKVNGVGRAELGAKALDLPRVKAMRHRVSLHLRCSRDFKIP